MAVSLVQSASASGSSGTITAVLPSAPTVGNILISVNTGFSTPPAGWTEIDSSYFPNAEYRIVQPGDGTNYSYGTGGAETSVTIREFSGVNLSSPIEKLWPSNSASSVTSVTTNGTGPVSTPGAILAAASDVPVSGSAAAAGTFNNSIGSDLQRVRYLASAFLSPTSGTYNITYTTNRSSYLSISAISLKALTITERNQVGNARIQTIVERNQLGVARISAEAMRDQVGLARLQTTVEQDQVGAAYIAGFSTRDQLGVANISNFTTQDQMGVSSIVYGAERDQLGYARIQPAARPVAYIARMSSSGRGVATTPVVKPRLQINDNAPHIATKKIRSYEIEDPDSPLCDDPVVLCDDPGFLAGKLVNIEGTPAPNMASNARIKVEINNTKSKGNVWPNSQIASPRSPRSTPILLSRQTTTPIDTIRYTKKSPQLPRGSARLDP